MGEGLKILTGGPMGKSFQPRTIVLYVSARFPMGLAQRRWREVYVVFSLDLRHDLRDILSY